MKRQLTILTLLISVAAYSQTVPSYVDTAGLKGWWSFTGNANDSSGNGHNGIVYGSTITLTTDRFGDTGSAYHFAGGSTDSIGTNYAGVLGDSDRTLSFWFNADSGNTITNEWVLFTYGSGCTGKGFGPCLLNNQLGIDGSCCYVYYNTTHIIPHHWYFGTVVFSTTIGTTLADVKFYINDTLQTSASYSLGTSTVMNTMSGHNLKFGSNGSSVCEFVGSLDDIGIWNRVLTGCEIKKLYLARNNEITNQPINDTVLSGSMATYSITVTGGTSLYQWQVNTGSGFTNLSAVAPYSGVNTQTLTINPTSLSMSGYKYRCYRVDTLSCTDTSNSAVLVVNLTSGLSNTQIENNIIISPNPTDNGISINSPVVIEKVEITNLLGQTVVTEKSTKNLLQIDLSGLRNGVYILKVNDSYFKKIVKQ